MSFLGERKAAPPGRKTLYPQGKHPMGRVGAGLSVMGEGGQGVPARPAMR